MAPHRIAMTKFRVSDHKLGVETGRYENIQYNDRKCNYCKSDAIDNEQHYLFHCPFTNSIRQDLINNTNYMSSKNIQTLFTDPCRTKSVARFIYLSNRKRSEKPN